MQYPWSDLFQLGLVASAFFPNIRERKGPVLEVVNRVATDPFFQALEFSGAESPEVQKELAAVFRSSGKSLVFSGGTYCYLGQNNLHDLDEDRRQKAVTQVERIIDEAIGYGCRILYVMGFEAPPEQLKNKAVENFARSLTSLAEYARKKNSSFPLTISVENFHILRVTPFLIGPTREFAHLLRGIRRQNPNVGLTFDTSHILQLKEDLATTYVEVQDVIAHIHLSNCVIQDPSSPFYGDKHPPYGFAGSEIGIDQMAAFLKLLKDSGHFSRPFPTGKPVLSLEVITPPGQTPEGNLSEAREAFQKAWEKFVERA